MLCALIMAGGKGTRFWPLSTEEKPKQFLNLIGDDTMLQMTVNRIKSIIPMEKIFISTGNKYVNLVKEQLPELPERNIIIEPEGRNTAPCIALAGFVINRYYNDSTMVVLPSDHLIGEEEKFRKIILDANNYLKNNKKSIITLGMTPNRPETGYGYIKYTDEKTSWNDSSIIKVEKFVEKPNLEKAQEYIENGSYLWNGGMFLWKTENILEQFKKYSSRNYEALCNVERVSERKLQEEINRCYSDTESISVDYAILEKSKDIYVIPSDIKWDDIGTWKSIERYREKDTYGNIISENLKAIECQESMAINSQKKVVMIGINNIMTVETDDTLYVVNKSYMENLRDYNML